MDTLNNNNYHKQKCEELRKIRVKMADTLGVPYVVRKEPCNFKGECRGTCPACYMEEKVLMVRIYELSIDGRMDMLFGEDIKVLKEKAFDEPLEMGDIEMGEIEMDDAIEMDDDITPFGFEDDITLEPTTDNGGFGKPVGPMTPFDIPPFTPMSGQIIPPPWEPMPQPDSIKPKSDKDKAVKDKKGIKIPGFLKGNK